MHDQQSTHQSTPSADTMASPDGPAKERDRSSGHTMAMAPPHVTGPQLTAISILSVLALLAGVLWSASYANLAIGSHEVKGAVMPPGMIQRRDLPAAAMTDMAAVNPDTVSYTAPTNARGDQLLQPRVVNGVKEFALDAAVIKWHILPNVQVMAYAFNHQVPGPRIVLNEGDHVRIRLTNHLPESTTIHWHGLVVPNGMDGPAEITQAPAQPGQSFTYEFTVRQAGTYFYHTHDHIDRQQALGLYGALIINPKDPARDRAYGYTRDDLLQLQEWTVKEGYTYPAMPMEGALPNYFTINGKSYPATETINLKVGQKVRIRFLGTNTNGVHPMHIHGGPFEVIAIDGEPVPRGTEQLVDTVNVGPGQRYDVIWQAREPGQWLIHCHISHHTTNDNVETDGGGGLMVIINVTG